MKKTILFLVMLAFVSTTSLATASGPDDVGGKTSPGPGVVRLSIAVNSGFDGTEPTQTGRINRTGIASTCANSKAYPGGFNPGNQHQYKTYSMSNGGSTCVTVNFNPSPGSGDDCGNFAHIVAYLNSYDPANQSVNYLGDVGSSLAQPFSFNAPAGAKIILVVNENTGSTQICNFEFSSDELNVGPLFSSIPIPTMNAWGLGALALVLGLVGFSARRRKVL